MKSFALLRRPLPFLCEDLNRFSTKMSSASEKIVPDSPPSEQQGDVKEIDEEFNGADINVRKLIRKIDWRLIPSVTILYLLSFLDRANGMGNSRARIGKTYAYHTVVGNAKVEGLADAINSSE